MTAVAIVLIGLVVYFVGAVATYGICYYFYGEPNGEVKGWWDWASDGLGSPLPALVCIVWFIFLPFILSANIGFRARQRLLIVEPKDISNLDESYKPGLWKGKEEPSKVQMKIKGVLKK